MLAVSFKRELLYLNETFSGSYLLVICPLMKGTNDVSERRPRILYPPCGQSQILSARYGQEHKLFQLQMNIDIFMNFVVYL